MNFVKGTSKNTPVTTKYFKWQLFMTDWLGLGYKSQTLIRYNDSLE